MSSSLSGQRKANKARALSIPGFVGVDRHSRAGGNPVFHVLNSRLRPAIAIRKETVVNFGPDWRINA